MYTQQERFVVSFAAHVTTVALVMTSHQMSNRSTMHHFLITKH